jgi:hypothetical protein
MKRLPNGSESRLGVVFGLTLEHDVKYAAIETVVTVAVIALVALLAVVYVVISRNESRAERRPTAGPCEENAPRAKTITLLLMAEWPGQNISDGRIGVRKSLSNLLA